MCFYIWCCMCFWLLSTFYYFGTLWTVPYYINTFHAAQSPVTLPRHHWVSWQSPVAARTIQSISRQCDPATDSRQLRLGRSSERSRSVFSMWLGRQWEAAISDRECCCFCFICICKCVRCMYILLIDICVCAHVYSLNNKYTLIIKLLGVF